LLMGQKRAGASPQYFGPDDRENVRLVFNSSGGILDHNNYKAILEMLNTPAQVNPFLGGGNVSYRQEVLGLLRAGARLYDPVTGRWISMDPIGFLGGDRSLYRYVHNSPDRWTDPSGSCQDPGGGKGTVRFCLSAFIPQKTVTSPIIHATFLGDNRGLSLTGVHIE
jgi:RHS repeat-associated protein